MKKFAQRSVLVIVDDVQSKELDLPTVEAYMEVEEAREVRFVIKLYFRCCNFELNNF